MTCAGCNSKCAVKYVVLNENTLGYINEERPNTLGVLAGSVIRGGHVWSNGPVTIVPTVDKVRPATREDLETYRVAAPPDTDLPFNLDSPNI
jgi:hypothetical protein